MYYSKFVNLGNTVSDMFYDMIVKTAVCLGDTTHF